MQVSRCTNAVRWFFLLTGWVLPGCGDARPQSAEPIPPSPRARVSRFDAATTGTIQGQVTWIGALPRIEALTLPANPGASEVLRPKQVRPNPNTPRIDAQTKGVGHAVVFLRGVDLQAARPWDHAPVRVEQRDGTFHIRQGAADSPYGFVRRGDPVVLVSCDALFYALHARGAAFFSHGFPDPDQPVTRHLSDKGLVELTSAAGYIWMRAYLFVDDHPYYTRTDHAGHFVLPQVPPGRYEMVCWMPHWVRARHERDPESGAVSRLFFKPPVEQVRTVDLAPGSSAVVNFTSSIGLFQEDHP